MARRVPQGRRRRGRGEVLRGPATPGRGQSSLPSSKAASAAGAARARRRAREGLEQGLAEYFEDLENYGEALRDREPLNSRRKFGWKEALGIGGR